MAGLRLRGGAPNTLMGRRSRRCQSNAQLGAFLLLLLFFTSLLLPPPPPLTAPPLPPPQPRRWRLAAGGRRRAPHEVPGKGREKGSPLTLPSQRRAGRGTRGTRLRAHIFLFFPSFPCAGSQTHPGGSRDGFYKDFPVV